MLFNSTHAEEGNTVLIKTRTAELEIFPPVSLFVGVGGFAAFCSLEKGLPELRPWIVTSRNDIEMRALWFTLVLSWGVASAD